MNKEKYLFSKKEVEEKEIDLLQMCSFVLSKWRLLIICGIIGCILGIPVGILMAKKDLVDTEELSPSIVAQLDNYANEKKLNESLNADDKDLYIMSLDPEGTYYTATARYTVRTDAHEDAELAVKNLNLTDSVEYLNKLKEVTGYTGYINNLNGLLSYNYEVSEAKEKNNGVTYLGQSGSTSEGISLDGITENLDEETASKLTAALQGVQSSDDVDLSSLLSQLQKDDQAYAVVTYSVSYLTTEQLDEFLPWIYSEVDKISNDYCSEYTGYSIKRIRTTRIPLRPTDVKTAQQGINSRVAGRETSVDIVVETMLAKYATTIAASSTTDGSPAIITDEEKEQYQEYWKYLTDEEYDNSISIVTVVKYMIIIGVVFAFLAAAYLMVAFLGTDPSVTERMLRDDYGLDILGFIEDGRKSLKGLDKAFYRSPNAMKATSFEYVAALIASASKDGRVVLAKEADIRDISKLIESLKALGVKDIISGDITTDKDILAKAKEAGELYIITELGKSKESNLEAQLHLIEMSELSLAGVVML